MVAAAPPARPAGPRTCWPPARQARRRRSLLAVAVAAVAAVAVLVAGSVLIGPSSAVPTARHPTPTAPAPPTVPGISPTQAQKIVDMCGVGYSGAEPGPGLALYNAIKSPWGMRYLLYGPHTYISCLHCDRGRLAGHGKRRADPVAARADRGGLVDHRRARPVRQGSGRLQRRGSGREPGRHDPGPARQQRGDRTGGQRHVRGLAVRAGRRAELQRDQLPAVRRRRLPAGPPAAADRPRRRDRTGADVLGHPGRHRPADGLVPTRAGQKCEPLVRWR